MDEILSGHSDFLLGKWLQAARDLGATESEKQLFEINAKNQITTWGPTGQIVDYAMKQWAGVIGDFCLPRWQLFFETCKNALDNNRNFNSNKFRGKVFSEIENPFTVDNKIYPTIPIGDPIIISRKLYNKWIKK